MMEPQPSTSRDLSSPKNKRPKLLQSVDEDISISGEHKTPSRQVSPHPPASASPATRASFSRVSPERNGDVFGRDEQEKLLKH